MAGTLGFWFRRQYRLAPTDPRFLDASLDVMAADYWAWRHAEDPNLGDEIVDEEFDVEAELAAADAEVEQVDDWEPV